MMAVVVFTFLMAENASAQGSDPVQVLFVANGYYQQEDDILDHLNDLGCYEVTTKKDYQIYGSTDLSTYDLIIITEFAPGIGYYGLQNLENSGKPILIVEYWDFWYSYKLGLVADDWAGYYGTDTVEVITPEHPVASRLGSEIQVYSSSYTVYGIPYNDIKDGVTPLIYSSSSFNEVAVLSDNDRKIAATGIYDTTRYTVRGWMLFDYLLNELYQVTPVREDPLSVWDDLIASELLVFLGQVEENPSGWTEDEVLREVWKKMVKWDLFSLSDQINLWVQEIFPELYIIPELIPTPCLHPSREGLGEWFLGFHGDSHTSCWTSDYISGVDLGISTEFLGRLVFYMGDTWGANFECIDQTSFYDKGSLRHCFSVDAGPAGEVCNDAVVESIDQDPSDGVDVGLFIDYHKGRYGYSPLTMLLLHDDPEMWYNDYAFSVPTGAATIYTDKYYPPNPPISAQPTIVVWYGRGIRTHNPVSWVGCSSDKLRFWNCYWGVGPFVSFSEADGDPGVCDETGSGKFINVSPVPIGSSDFEIICTNDPSSYLCNEEEIDRSGGLLIFGSGPGCDDRYPLKTYRLGPLYFCIYFI